MREYSADMERAVIAELEDVRLQLEPLEQVKNVSKSSARFFQFPHYLECIFRHTACAMLSALTAEKRTRCEMAVAFVN